MYSYDLYICPDRPLVPPEPVSVCRCRYCCDDIWLHTTFVNFRGDNYHPDCFIDNAPSLLAEEGAVFIDGDESASDESIIGRCACCNEDVFAYEDHVKYDKKVFHDDCFCDNAAHRLYELGAREDVAERHYSSWEV